MPHASRVALITGCGKPVGIGNSTARALAALPVVVGFGMALYPLWGMSEIGLVVSVVLSTVLFRRRTT